MNDVAKYTLLMSLGVCLLVFLACAALTLFLIPLAFGSGLKAFRDTQDPRAILAARRESPWILPIFLLLRKVQTLAGTGALALGICTMLWTLIAAVAK